MAHSILWAAVGFIGLDVLTAIFWNKRYVERDASTRALTVLFSGGMAALLALIAVGVIR